MTATRADDGYTRACEEHPDVIVTDVLLPDANGLALCERLRTDASTASIPVIVLTGDDASYAAAHARRSELTGVLMKPCSGDRLLAAVRQAMARRG